MIDYVYVSSDVILGALSLVATLYSYRVWRLYSRDIMRTVAALSTVAFSAMVASAAIDLALRLDFDVTNLVVVRVGVAFGIGLMAIAWAILLRWAGAGARGA